MKYRINTLGHRVRPCSYSFFSRPAIKLAPALLGKFLIRRFPDGSVKEGMIVETEAYTGVEDQASHAAGGRRTKRNEVMYGPAGRAYVYFTYGMHWLLNVVCAGRNDPQAVLIRGLDTVTGPARLTKMFGITGELNGEDLTKSRVLWIEDRPSNTPAPQPPRVQRAPRIGVDYAGEWKDKLLRFTLLQLA